MKDRTSSPNERFVYTVIAVMWDMRFKVRTRTFQTNDFLEWCITAKKWADMCMKEKDKGKLTDYGILTYSHDIKKEETSC